MAGTLKLTALEASAGSTITVDSATTLSLSADKLSVGGVLLSQGNTAVNVLTAASTDLADVAHTAMWTGKSKAIFSVDASGGAKTVQLPAANAAGRSTVSIVISVKATSAVPATVSPNLVTVNNSSGAEVFTLYAVGDHVEFVSDGTNDLRTGNEHISAKGFVYRTADIGVASAATVAMFSAGTVTVRDDWGAWWNGTNFAVVIPYACRILVETLIFNYNSNMYLGPDVKRYYSSRASNESILRTDNKTGNPTGNGPMWSFTRDFEAGDEIEYNVYNLYVGSSMTMSGGAAGWRQGSYGKWTVLRRY